MEDLLEGLNVVLAISDPWDLGNAQGWKPHEGNIIFVGYEGSAKAAVVQLKNPFEYRGVRCEYFVATARHVGESVDILATGKSVFCNLTRIPPERLTTDNPCDLSWWRGGIGVIGRLSPLPASTSGNTEETTVSS